MSISPQEHEARIRENGARALQMHLTREIGVAAVAAALQCSKLPDPRGIGAGSSSWHTPATLACKNRAA